MIDPERIQDPRFWHLLLEVRPSGLSAVAYAGNDGQGLMLEQIPLTLPSGEIPATARTAPPLRQLEDAVYDHPALLMDYRRVTVLFDTPRFMALPDALDSSSDMLSTAFEAAFPSAARREILVSPVPPMKLTIAFEAGADTLGFFRRTFHNVTFRPVLAPLCAYFRMKYPGGGRGKTLVNFDGDRMDMVVLGSGAPLALNSYRFRDPMDAVYYILAVRKELDLADTEEIMIGGDRTVRGAVTPVLRRFVRYVMPAIFPSVMFRAGRDALAAPFPLVLAPLTT